MQFPEGLVDSIELFVWLKKFRHTIVQAGCRTQVCFCERINVFGFRYSSRLQGIK